MKRLMIYPFHSENAPVARYSHLIGYEVTAAVSPRSWGYTGKDMCFCDGGSKTGIIVTEDFLSALHFCDIVFLDFVSDKIDRNVYLQNINSCISTGKEIIVTHRLDTYLMGTLPRTHQIRIIGKSMTSETDENYIIPIDIPTIVVAGIGESCDKFSVQLAVREFLADRCDSILQFGTKDYSELFGFLPLPEFLYLPGDISKKIISLNHYIYKEVKRTSPEVLIVGIPGGFSYMTMAEPKNFGELPFCISNALLIDTCIFSCYGEEYTIAQINDIIKKASGKLACTIDGVHISNHRLIVDTNAVDDKVSSLTVSNDYLRFPQGTFNVFDKSSTESVLGRIYQMLVDAEDII